METRKAGPDPSEWEGWEEWEAEDRWEAIADAWRPWEFPESSEAE